MNPLKLIGIHGHAGSGKDTVAEFLMDEYDATWRAFADPLKEACAILFDIPDHKFHDAEHKEVVDSFWHVSPRKIAQYVGTELVRRHIGQLVNFPGSNFWIHRMEKELENQPDNQLVVISDVRFQNELDWVLRNNGLIIHLTRPGADGTVGIPNHASEQDLDTNKEGVWSINNDSTLDSLFEKVDILLKHCKFI